MAANEYLKMASAQLVRAADAVYQEASQLRVELDRTRKSIESDIKTLQHQLVVREAELSMHSTDPVLGNKTRNDIEKIKGEIAAKQQEMADATSNIQKTIAAKESMQGTLMSQAKNLDGMSGHAALQ